MQTKKLTAKIKAVERDGKTYYPFVLTTNDIDRDGEIIDVATLNIENFKSNPILMLQHDNFTAPIGTWANIQKDGNKVTAEATFHKLPDYQTEKRVSEIVEQYVKEGVLQTCSIGFMVGETELLPIENDVYIRMPDGSLKEIPNSIKEYVKKRGGATLLKNCELYEASIVTIPANPNATAKMKALNDVITNDVKTDETDVETNNTLTVKETTNNEIVENENVKNTDEEKAGRPLSEATITELKNVKLFLKEAITNINNVNKIIDKLISGEKETDVATNSLTVLFNEVKKINEALSRFFDEKKEIKEPKNEDEKNENKENENDVVTNDDPISFDELKEIINK